MRVVREVYVIAYVLTIIINLIVAGITFALIYPVATGEITVIPPSPSQVVWEYGEPYLNLTLPVTLRNGGYFTISDMSLSFLVENGTATFLDFTHSFGDVKPQSVSTQKVIIPINLKKLYELEAPHFHHFYRPDTFRVTVGVSANYGGSLVHFDADYMDTLEWEPVFKDAGTTGSATMRSGEEGQIISIPFYIVTASYLFGTAHLSATVRNETEVVGTASQDIPLGGRYDGTLEVLFTGKVEDFLTRSQNLTIETQISFAGLELERVWTYRWRGPMEGLWIDMGSDGTIRYGFTNGWGVGYTAEVNVTLYSGGDVVGYGEDSYYVGPQETVERTMVISAWGVPDRVVVRISCPDYGFSVTREVTG